MKCLIMFLILLLVPFVILKNTPNNFFPNLPLGEYKVYAKAIIRCGLPKEQAMEFNFYLNKISTYTSELRGNLTLKKPFDDSFDTIIHLAVKDSMGGWKDNFYTQRVTKPCTNGKPFIAGSAWQMIEKSFDYEGYCPIPPSVYVSKGFDITGFVYKLNIPKQFFYGTYKCGLEIFEKNGKQAACLQVIIDVKRPWEPAE